MFIIKRSDFCRNVTCECMHEHLLSVFCLSVQWDYCDLSKRQDRSVLLDYKEKSYCSYLLRYWVAPSSVLWVVQEFFEIKIWDFGTKDLGKHTTKHRTSVLKIWYLPIAILFSKHLYGVLSCAFQDLLYQNPKS